MIFGHLTNDIKY